MPGQSSPDDSSDEQGTILRRLAETLDVPPTAFSDPTVSDLSQTNELLRLWHGIADRQYRAKVLAIVRTIASRE